MGDEIKAAGRKEPDCNKHSMPKADIGLHLGGNGEMLKEILTMDITW